MYGKKRKKRKETNMEAENMEIYGCAVWPEKKQNKGGTGNRITVKLKKNVQK